MAKITIVFGVLLAALGVVFFVMTGSAHKTALIPTWFGLVLILSGVLANTENAKQRMLWMHIAVTAGLLGFLFPGIRALIMIAKVNKAGLVLGSGAATAVQEEIFMSVICLVFTAMCVRSFIQARVLRKA
ncbi:CD20-like domain-containing protein [Granulicella cerasi]|uniref:CD20-like domain-containing protein n=1 Tax=Granulicella cerasi TaxID=741063 RepID=A0ABW1Z3D0_9BACT|nr:CD20-like domain-containing protein [Granulicella cerasi]